MTLHLLRIRRNVNRNVFNDRKNVSATTCYFGAADPPKCENICRYECNSTLWRQLLHLVRIYISIAVY